MAPNTDQEDGEFDSTTVHSLHDMDRVDPPPPPSHKDDTAKQVAKNEAKQDAWIGRNLDYLKSFDSRGLQHLPLLSRLWGYDYEWYNARIISQVAEVTSWAGRRLDPEEMQIFASHIARGTVAGSYDRPVAIGATTFALWRGWSSYRMPFYQPRFSTFAHPQATARPFLSSLCWHSARTGIYGLLGFTAYKLLGPRYRVYMRNSSYLDAIECDPGLEELEEDISKNLGQLDSERDSRQDKKE